MLILTEKPSVAKDFAAALNCIKQNGYYQNAQTNIQITNCIGHLFSLYDAQDYNPEYKDWHKIPVIPEIFKYKISEASKMQAGLVIKLLKENSNKEILIATDADREGEIIARECLILSGIRDYSKIRRFWVSQALTKEVILEGLKNARPFNEYNELGKKGFVRQRSDWLVGINGTRYMTICAESLIPIGRVQTAILRAIYDRCKAINNFVSTKYYEHYGIFGPAGSSSVRCKGIYFEKDKTAFEDDTRKIKLKNLKNLPARLLESKIEDKILNPPQLYNLNDLQKDAFKHFGYSAETTLDTVQKLYEELKCVSYPRTPSKVMGACNVQLCKEIVNELAASYSIVKDIIPYMNISLGNKRCFDDSKLEAHHALIPLRKLPADATGIEKNIYKLIFNRFIQAFLPECKYQKLIYILDVSTNTFRVVGKKIISAGWKDNQFKNLTLESEQKNDEEENESQDLSEINFSQLNLIDIETKEKWTKPPKYFNEASILAFMENPKSQDTDKKLIGLGTAATRHTFIPKLLSCNYITINKKNIEITDKGIKLLQEIEKTKLKRIADISETTEWEEKIETAPDGFLNEIVSFVKESISISNIQKLQIPSGKIEIKCPLCHKEIKRGKNNWYCSGYKEGCKFPSIWDQVAGAKITEKDVQLLCSGKKSSLKHCSNKAGKKFDCKFVLNLNTYKIDLDFTK